MRSNRRDFIKTGAILGTGILIHSTRASALMPSITSKFELPALGYSFNALEPYIDAQTMEIHYTKHHQAYINKLNDAIAGDASLAGKSIEELIQNIESLPEKLKNTIRNNGGGHWNHSFFWPLLKTGTTPHGKLLAAINRDFGSMENFTQAFEKAALSQFGSGWAWLIQVKNKLIITNTPNQDNPLMEAAVTPVNGKPVIALDVWEHAYYIKYQNKRADYTKAFWNVLNWELAEKNFVNG